MPEHLHLLENVCTFPNSSPQLCKGKLFNAHSTDESNEVQGGSKCIAQGHKPGKG